MNAVASARPAWPGLIPWLRGLFHGDRSPAETAERLYRARQLRDELQLLETLRPEADGYAEEIRKTLTRKGVCYRYTKTERKEIVEKVQEVQFVRPYSVSAEVIKIKIDTRRLPRGVGLADLENDEILRLLSYNCKHRVTVRGSHETGFWYWIERQFGIGGIPTHLAFEEALESRPATLAGERLAFPVGVGENKRLVWRTIPQVVNLLVAGSPDRGKSNFVNSIICTLLKHNDPRQLRLMLVDLKGGLEFNFYAGLDEYLLWIPKPKRKGVITQDTPPIVAHAIAEDIVAAEQDPEILDETERVDEGDPDEAEYVMDHSAGEKVKAFIERREEVPAALTWLIGEAERRMALIREAGCKKISEYNQRHSFHPLPYILFVCDEWADIKLTPRIGARSEERLINITNRARAVGIHTIVCTQSPNRDVLSIRVKNAMNSRMVFGCADQYMSQGLLGDYSATKLETRGRGIWVSGRDRMELQTPFIPNDLVEQIAAAAGGGQVTRIARAARHDVTEREIIEWALTRNNGHLGWRELYAEFAERKMSADDARRIGRSLVGRIVDHDGRQYEVAKATGLPSPKPVRLLPVIGASTGPETPAASGMDSGMAGDSAAWPDSPNLGGMAGNAGMWKGALPSTGQAVSGAISPNGPDGAALTRIPDAHKTKT